MSGASSRGRAAPQGRWGAGIARLLTRAPRLVVAVWIAIVATLGVLGIGIERKLILNVPYVPGAQSARAHEIVQREFGSDEVLVVMLSGPHGRIERQGPALAARLGGLRDVQVISPWAHEASVTGLEPSPGVAALVLRSDRGEAVASLLSAVRGQVRASISAPVRASVAGFPVALEQLRAATNGAAKLGFEIAVPVLSLVLLLVFRSVLAALLPVIVGGAVVAATRGVLDLALGITQIDLFAVGVTSMLGLALGVDYSLLVVSRYREERSRAGADREAAVAATVAVTARSIVPAGCALILAMIASTLLIPDTTVLSAAIAIVTVATLSMLSGVCVVPALLSLMDGKLDRWSLPRRRRTSRAGPLAFARRIADHPRAAVPIVLAMLLLAGLASTLKTEIGGIGLLPAGNPSRLQQEEVARKLGAGWLSPMEIVVDGHGHPVTSPARLRAFAAFQRQVERAPGVQTVAGLSQIYNGAGRMLGMPRRLRSQERGLDRLQAGLTRVDSSFGAARGGAQALTDSLRQTSAGSVGLEGALNRVDQGSGDLAHSASAASSGAGRLTAAMRAAQRQSSQVQDSAHLLESAMREGEERLARLQRPLRATEERLGAAWQALQRMTSGRGDPEYAALAEALRAADQSLTGNDIRTGERVNSSDAGLAEGLEGVGGQFHVGSYLAERLDRSGRQAGEGIAKLAGASARLRHGLRSLAAGSAQLAGGIASLDLRGAALSPALGSLSEGSQRLSSGLGAIATGAGSLTTGLGAGAKRQQLPSGLFQSSYFLLAGLDGSGPEKRRQIGFLVNIDNGGGVARMIVIPTGEAAGARAAKTLRSIQRDAAALARRTGSEVLVGGADPVEIELNRALRDDVPLLRVLLSLISMFVLVLVMRSLTMPAISALINVVTVGASMGLLALLFNGSLLGGPGYVETMVLLAAVMVMFGLAIDYEVFVFARMREEYDRTGSTEQAVAGGLERTAPIITGAAVIMITVFLAFSVSEYAPYRDFGVAQALGVFIDVFVVRLIVLPVIMRKLGAASWWMPRRLRRLFGARP